MCRNSSGLRGESEYTWSLPPMRLWSHGYSTLLGIMVWRHDLWSVRIRPSWHIGKSEKSCFTILIFISFTCTTVLSCKILFLEYFSCHHVMCILSESIWIGRLRRRASKTKNSWKPGMFLRVTESSWLAETGGLWEGAFNSAQIRWGKRSVPWSSRSQTSRYLTVYLH